MNMTSEQLLFTDKNGHPVSLEDLIDDGLDVDYAERLPGLLDLLASGSPKEQMLSCIVLTSWGSEAGFAALERWASAPEAVPWSGAPVSVDRHFGVDDAFERLADAIRTSRLAGASREQRTAALEALLGIYHRKYFGRALAAVLLMDADLLPSCADAMRRAVEAALAALGAPPEPFDMATQAAALIEPLATQNAESAARCAEQLMQRAPDNMRALRELSCALRQGEGATLGALKVLAQSPHSDVREEAERSLAARVASAASPVEGEK